VFLGDSLTFGCEWRELFGNEALILNRGIGGDTSAGVLKRADSVAALKPLAVFLMIGTNDAPSLGYRPSDTVENHRAIVQRILHDSPETKIYEESILPSRVPRFNQWSAETNEGIRRLADGKSVIYLNLRDAFLENGELSNRFTSDGLHLNGSGYLLWKQQVDPIVKELIAAQLRDGARPPVPER
jgi:lysophospholipase L1-like esterase